MKPAPSNTNVPQWMWDSAVRQHDAYRKQYDGLRGLGLSDAEADEYIDTHDALANLVEMLRPTEPDFFVDDHSRQIDDAENALAVLRGLLSKT